MTDTEQKRIKEICEMANIDDISDLSDGYHTFRQLYYQRMILFAALVKQNRDKAWKSLRHEDGELCFGGGWFIVGIDTPKGSYTYHYEDTYFSLFDCEELERGKHWDGHTEKDVIRLLSLEQQPSEDCISRQAAIEALWKALHEYEDKTENQFSGSKELDVADWFQHRIFVQNMSDIDRQTILNLPSATPQPKEEPQPKTGHWVLSGGYWRCSECKEKSLLKLDKATGGYREYEPVRSKYCPQCGAKMQEVKK